MGGQISDRLNAVLVHGYIWGQNCTQEKEFHVSELLITLLGLILNAAVLFTANL